MDIGKLEFFGEEKTLEKNFYFSEGEEILVGKGTERFGRKGFRERDL